MEFGIFYVLPFEDLGKVNSLFARSVGVPGNILIER